MTPSINSRIAREILANERSTNSVVFSADTHVMEPSDLFTRRLPPQYQWRAPYWHRFPDGQKLFQSNGLLVGMSPDYFRVSPGGNAERIVPDDPKGFMNDLEADGVRGALIHPNVGLHLFEISDIDLAFECARIYNDYVAELFADYSQLVPAAIVPLLDIEEAVAEIDRVGKLGFSALEMSMTAGPEAPYFSKRYDPVWERAQKLHLPICTHVGTGLRRAQNSVAGGGVAFLSPTNSAKWPEGHPDHNAAIVSSKTLIGGFGGYGGQPLEIVTGLIGGGALDRFPDLQFIMVETGTRWLMNFLDTMDDAWYKGPGVNEVNRMFYNPVDGVAYPQFQDDELNLDWPYPLKPSDYVRRQVHFTFQDDWYGLRNRAFTGVDPLLWGNDYPHNEGSWPESRQAIDGMLHKVELSGSELSGSELSAVFEGTVVRLLGLAA